MDDPVLWPFCGLQKDYRVKQSIFTERKNKVNLMVIQKEYCLDEQVYCICCSSDGPMDPLLW
uniref:Uncharacterized protein n=1 Tax=Daphnia magna TaxID=35525 RepID=A0A0P5Z5I2_9CRUS